VFSKIAVTVLFAVAVSSGAVALFNHYENLVAQNATLQSNVVRLKAAVDTEKAATGAAVKRIDDFAEAMRRNASDMMALSERTNTILSETRKIPDVLAKHDLAALLSRKQVLTLRAVNRGTERTWRLFERATARSAHNTDGATSAGAVTVADPSAR
jgi:hypothetical protein